MAEIVEHFCTRHGSYWPPTAVDHLFPCPKCKAEREERKQAAMRHLAMGAPAAAKAASDRVLSDISAMREIVAKYRDITNSKSEYDLCTKLLGDTS